MTKILRNERGSAILIVLTLMAMISLLTVISVDRATEDINLSFNLLHSEKAFYGAEAGINHAVSILNDSVDWRTGIAGTQVDDITYIVALVDSSTQAGLDDTVVVYSTAIVDGGISTIQAMVVPKSAINPFKYAVFADSAVTLIDNACTDSYNSDSGSFAATYLSDGGHVGSNSTIILADNATAGGDVSTSYDGGITIDPGATVMGDTTTTANPQVIDSIPQSTFDWALANNAAPAGITGSQYQMTPGPHDLWVNTHKTITLSSGDYYFTSLLLNDDAKLRIAPGASVRIYVTGNITLKDGAQFNGDGNPGDAIIYSNGTSLSLADLTKFHAAYYGPNATFSHLDNAEVFGSIITQSTVVGDVSCVHYDRALNNLDMGPASKGVAIVALREM